jgi:Flp pilus assembly pilin Flp
MNIKGSLGKPDLLGQFFSEKSAQQFWKDESGQDLIEYTLLIAAIVLGSAALFAKVGTSTSTIWGGANTTLHNAVLAAGS